MISITLIRQNVNTKIKLILLSGLLGLLPVIGWLPGRVAAADFSSGTYGACAYQQVGSCAPATTTTTSQSGLAYTGQPGLLIAGIAILAIGTGGLILSIQRSRRRQHLNNNNPMQF